MNETMGEERNTENLNIQEQLEQQQKALAQIYISVEKTRKYIFWTTIANVCLFVIPLIGVAVAFPFIMNTFTSSLGAMSDPSVQSETTPTSPSLRDSLKNLKDLGY